MTDFEHLLELRKKATQGELRNEFAGAEGYVEYDLRTKEGDYIATVQDYWTAVYLAFLWNFFDLPSTQAMLEAGEGKEAPILGSLVGKASDRPLDARFSAAAAPFTTRSNARDAERWRRV